LIFSSPRDHESNFVLDPEWALGSSAESLKQTNPGFLNDRPSVETNLSESPRPCLLVHHPHQNCALNRMSPTSDICDTIPGSTQAAPSPVRHPRGGVSDGTFTGAVLTTKITPPSSEMASSLEPTPNSPNSGKQGKAPDFSKSHGIAERFRAYVKGNVLQLTDASKFYRKEAEVALEVSDYVEACAGSKDDYVLKNGFETFFSTTCLCSCHFCSRDQLQQLPLCCQLNQLTFSSRPWEWRQRATGRNN